MRIAIAEDSVILRDGLVSLLTRRGHEMVAAVDNGTELLSVIDTQVNTGTPCDVAVIDIRMPPTFTEEGLRTALEVRERHPDHGVLLFSQYVETRFATELLRSTPEQTALERLTRREVEVLELMALGRTNSAIASELYLSAGAVEKNISSIFIKLDLPEDDAAHRRVLAVLRYLSLATG